MERRSQNINLSPAFIKNASYAGVILLLLIFLVVVVGMRDQQVGLMIIGGLLALIAGIAIFLRPELGAYLLVFTITTNISAIFTDRGLPSINKPLVALVTVALLASYLFRRNESVAPPRLGRPEYWLMALGGAWFLSVLSATDRTVALNAFTDFVKDFVILIDLIFALRTRKQWETAAWLFILSLAGLSLLGVYQKVTNNYTQTFFGLATIRAEVVVGEVSEARLSGPIEEPNFWGLVLASGILVAVYRVFGEKNWFWKLAAAGSALLMLAGMVGSYSRGAFLALAGGLALFVVERRIKFSVLLPLGLAALITVPFLPQSYRDRLATLSLLTPRDQYSVYRETSFRGRAAELQAAWEMFIQNPILGLGPNNYAINYQDYARRIGLERRTQEREAHSMYLQIMAETGLIGMVAFGGLFLSLYGGAWHLRRRLREAGDTEGVMWLAASVAGLTAYMIGGAFLHLAYIRYLWLLVGIVITALHVYGRDPAAKIEPAVEAA